MAFAAKDDRQASRYSEPMTDASAPFLLETLRDAHRRIDIDIEALRSKSGYDQLELARLKKRKLRLRDEIERLSDAMVPDLIA